MDFNIFDAFLDSIFVIDENRKIKYCNDAAASLCNSSVKRLVQDTPIYDIISFSNKELFPNEHGKYGESESTGYHELDYEVVRTGDKGKVQVCVEPFKNSEEKAWLVTLHDVTIEDKLHSKYHSELKSKEDLIEQLEAAKSELESYNKNLEMIISERTRELSGMNSTLRAMMDSLGQGFLIIDSRGICGNIYTKSCEEILECVPNKLPLWDVLAMNEEISEQTKLWIAAVFQEALPFESLQELGPKVYNNTSNKYVTLDFFPIRDEEGNIVNLVMVATDKTLEYKASKAMEKERHHSEMILKIVKNKDQFGDFLNSLEPKISKAIKYTKLNDDDFDLDEVLRFLHTFEGECGVFSVHQLGQRARKCQQILSPLKSVWEDDVEVVRGEFNVEVAKMTHDYEQFIRENQKTFQLVGLFESKKVEVKRESLENFYTSMVAKDARPSLLEKFEYTFLMESVYSYLKHYDDVAQSVAERQGKRVNPVEFIGCDFRLKGEWLVPFFESLVHAFRNAVDHGIESVEDRVAQFKKPAGSISVEFSEVEYENEPAYKFIVRDDGRGIDPEIIRPKVKEFDPNIDLDSLSDFEIIQYIFMPSFTSKNSVEEFSGRGVGMDAIKNQVEELGGEIMIKSIIGQGSTLTMIIPVQNIEHTYSGVAA